MKRSVFAAGFPAPARRRGFTLIEMLVAVTLTLVMMGAVVQVFGMLGTSVNDSRAVLEMVERLRATEGRLRMDLQGQTVTMIPPRDPSADEGYFEITEGPLWTAWQLNAASKPAYLVPQNVETGGIDYTVADNDDYLMFTVRTSPDRAFVGRFDTSAVESTVAEVYWFVRGTTLYRRVLLVKPEVMQLDTNGNGVLEPNEWDRTGQGRSFFEMYDIAVRPVVVNGVRGVVANTLSDLTMPEWRYAHQRPVFPFHPHLAGQWSHLGLPTLSEASSAAGFMEWLTDMELPDGFTLAASGVFDAWRNPFPWDPTVINQNNGSLLPPYAGPRRAEDVMMTDVIGFDVKVFDPYAPVLERLINSSTDEWTAIQPGDPGYLPALALLGNSQDVRIAAYGAYVDLGFAPDYPFPQPKPLFNGYGDWRSGVGSSPTDPYTPWTSFRVYDTYSTHYDHDGVDQSVGGYGQGTLDTGSDGFDNGGLPNVVDDWMEKEAAPPYPVPLRGIQIKIRAFERDSRTIREVTIRYDFPMD